jgi:hypothetical protein
MRFIWQEQQVNPWFLLTRVPPLGVPLAVSVKSDTGGFQRCPGIYDGLHKLRVRSRVQSPHSEMKSSCRMIAYEWLLGANGFHQ